jgi:hypothetical protein
MWITVASYHRSVLNITSCVEVGMLMVHYVWLGLKNSPVSASCPPMNIRQSKAKPAVSGISSWQSPELTFFP